jgi:hypothetical protein
MSSLTILGDTSGSVVLQAPAVSGSTTITMPAATGTMMVSGNMPAFSAYQSSAQTVSTNTYTKILFQTEEFDTNSNFSSSRFTPTIAGYYQLNSSVQINDAFTGGGILIYKNGTEYKRGQITDNSAAYTGTFIVTGLVYFNGTTDYAEIYIRIGIGQTLVASSSGTTFQGSMVRTA